jgi:UDP-N-acetylglucosamine--N-acetylmuramyl-(pentapeptide) pyrophosphoryl-undecaprenol N-acetylglucosamine transferase
MHVVVAGGGSAGHVNPALSVADALRRAVPEIGITMLGTAGGLETELVPARGYPLVEIPRVALPRRPTLDLASLPARLMKAVTEAGRVIGDVRADVVVGFGGFVALPAYLAARRKGVPIVVHEANVRPGLANRVGARFTSYVAVAFPGTPLPHARYVGLPLRRAVADLDRDALRAEARAAFGLLDDAPTLLVTGGSQGASRLNETMVAAAPSVAAAGVQVLHHAGKTHAAGVAEAIERAGGTRTDTVPPWVVVPYVDRMELAYAAADLAVCRAGANTCAELAAVGLPAVYVPLGHGNGEQRLNALPTVRAGGGLLVANADFDAEWVRANVVPLVCDEERLAAMGKAAATHGRRGADDELAALVLEAIATGHR